MPITNINSYVPTMNEFIAHWTQVDAALPTDLTLIGPDQTVMTREGFIALRDTLQTQFQVLVGYLNDREIARGGIRIDKARMLAQFNEFNAMLDGYWGGTPFANARANAPSVGDGEERFLAPMRDVFSLWGKLNDAPPPPGLVLPLQLSDGTEIADFGAEITSLQAAHALEAVANQNAVLTRSERDATMETARAAMISYRKIVPARCAQLPTLVETLPAVSPPPGHTPDPVAASAVFVPPDQAQITHAASTEPTLLRYELRGNPGDSYDEEDAVLIASHTPDQPREFLTAFGLTHPGTRATFKIFTILETGNEAGSAAMTVERPE